MSEFYDELVRCCRALGAPTRNRWISSGQAVWHEGSKEDRQWVRTRPRRREAYDRPWHKRKAQELIELVLAAR